MSEKENASGAQVPCISLLADSECGIGELLRRREAALREYMRLDELLYFAMKRKITEANSVNNTTSRSAQSLLRTIQETSNDEMS